MNLLNQKMLIENVVTEDVENKTVEDIKVSSTNDDAENNKIESDPTQISNDNVEYTMSDKGVNALDEIEEEIVYNDRNGFDEVCETVTELSMDLENISLMLENISVKSHAAQYNLLTETTDNKSMQILYETTINTLWSKFIEVLTSFIEKAKRLVTNLTFKAMAHFDYYGKWADRYNENLKKKKSSGIALTPKHMSGYNYDRVKLYQDTDYSRLHEYAASIIGNATTTEDMERKLKEYEDRDFDAASIYSYIMTKCCGVHVSGNDKTMVKTKIINNIRGNIANIKVDTTTVNQALTDLRNVKLNVGKYSKSSRNTILNPEFDKILKNIKEELNANRDDKDNIRYKYYRARYEVFSKAQQAAFDIFQIKISCIKEHANQCMKICKTYVSREMEESIDFSEMNNEIAQNAVVLD